MIFPRLLFLIATGTRKRFRTLIQVSLCLLILLGDTPFAFSNPIRPNMKAFICVPASPIRKQAADESEIVNQALFGETVEILQMQGHWAKVRCCYDGYEGYMDSKQYRRLTDEEAEKVEAWKLIVTEQFAQIAVSTALKADGTGETAPMLVPMGARLPMDSVTTIAGLEICHSLAPGDTSVSLLGQAFKFLNAPYLWGGRTVMGLDCSGFTQVVYKTVGIALRRDASQQVRQGVEVARFEDAREGDLIFFANSKGYIIHVGILISPSTIMHCSGRVRIDRVDKKGLYNNELGRYTHNLASIRRVTDGK